MKLERERASVVRPCAPVGEAGGHPARHGGARRARGPAAAAARAAPPGKVLQLEAC